LQSNVRFWGSSDIDTPCHATTIPAWDSIAAKWRTGAGKPPGRKRRRDTAHITAADINKARKALP